MNTLSKLITGQTPKLPKAEVRKTSVASLSLTLPYPPSVNHIYRPGKNGRLHLTKEAKAYRKNVEAAVWEQCSGPPPTMTGRLVMLIEVNPPDKRKHDLDNLLKASFDAMEHAGVYGDDSQIKNFQVIELEVQAPGRLTVTIELMVEDSDDFPQRKERRDTNSSRDRSPIRCPAGSGGDS